MAKSAKTTKKEKIVKDERMSWDEYFMGIAHLASKRSSCLRRSVGAVIVKDNHILSSGYNGAPAKTKHCKEVGCLRQKLNVPSGQRHELCRGLHAEQNAFLQAALYGIPLQGAKMYITVTPCVICAKMIINAGVEEIIIDGEYPDKMAMDFLKEAKVKVRKLKK